MSRNQNPRSELKRRLRYGHQILMTETAMDTIEQFYHENIKGSIYHVGMYRAINIVFSVLVLAGMIIFWNHPETVQMFITGSIVVLIVYNVIHLLVNVFQYKTIKEPEPFDEIPSEKPVKQYGQE